ncbi:hypothetical protein KSP39_PZI003597 [Platanthera zijinensis]|uniref:Uncharacterized protein n=1 Tax=Platanthera zijinensis TaxID=2320716 RepID=A0AAP0GCN0_9ASPA
MPINRANRGQHRWGRGIKDIETIQQMPFSDDSLRLAILHNIQVGIKNYITIEVSIESTNREKVERRAQNMKGRAKSNGGSEVNICRARNGNCVPTSNNNELGMHKVQILWWFS